MKDDKIRYFIYARRSVEKRDREESVASIDSQIDEMRALAKAEGLKVVGTFSETKTGSEPYVRTEFAEMIKQIQAGKANGILVWKVDRLGRNAIDEGTIKYLLHKGIIKNIRAIDRNWYSDDNALISSVEFGVAQQYSRDLKKHIKRGQNARLAEGVRPGIAPIGYRNTKFREMGKKEEIVPDPHYFPIVKRVFEYLLSGKYTAAEVHRLAIKEWGLNSRGTSRFPAKGISFTSFYNMVHNPFYYGEFNYGGQRYQGTHTPMITKEEFLRVQDILEGKSQVRPHNGKHAYTGTMRCGECGAGVTVEDKTKVQKNGNVHRYILYRCNKSQDPHCSQGCINEKELERQINEYLAQIDISPEVHEWALQELDKARKDDQHDNRLVVLNKQKELTNCNNKLERLNQLVIEGTMDAETYKAAKEKTESEKRELEEFISNAEAHFAGELKRTRERLDFALQVRKAFAEGDSRKKKEIFTLLSSERILKDKKLYLKIENPLVHLDPCTFMKQTGTIAA